MFLKKRIRSFIWQHFPKFIFAYMYRKNRKTNIAWFFFPKFMASHYLKKIKTQKTAWWGIQDFYKDIEENCTIFLPSHKLTDKAYKKQLACDIIIACKKYGIVPNEYFSYEFERKKEKDQKTYLSRMCKDMICIATSGENWSNIYAQLKDKNVFYKMAKDFFYREVCKVECKSDRDNFAKFCTKINKFIVKPSKGSCGKGIEIIDLTNKSIDEVFDYLLQSGQYIVEEIVTQDSRLARWNTSSLNTIRFPSIRTKTGITPFLPAIRVGTKGQIVDNAGSGGCFASIDIESGIIISHGYNRYGKVFEKHPDSGITFKGFAIPHWKELKEFAKEVHLSMPEQYKYIGFDFALSDKGWVLIEANWGDFILQQTSLKRGSYNEFKNAVLK